MHTIKTFFKQKGLYLFCLAVVFAATAAGIFGIRQAMRRFLGQDIAQPGLTQEDATWNRPDAVANNPVTDLPQPTPAPTSAPSALPSAVPSPSGASSAATGAQGASGGSAASSAPSPVSPVAGGKVSAPFSGDELVYHATLGDWRTHNGTDYTAPAGAEVYAMTGGTVSALYEDALWGQVVEVTAADGTLWRYCGLAAATPARGDQVAAGQVLGALGDAQHIAAEADAGPHLHLECLRDGAYLDAAQAR